MVYTHHCASPFGGITAACNADGDALVGLWFDGQTRFGSTLTDCSVTRCLPILRDAERWLDIYFSGHEPDFLPPISLDGSPFRLAVWNCLREIPWGQVITYGEVARRLEGEYGRRISAQAVGGAVGHNPISLMIPCHRVIGADGCLVGYAGGLGLKRGLLQLEGADLSGQHKRTARRPVGRR